MDRRIAAAGLTVQAVELGIAIGKAFDARHRGRQQSGAAAMQQDTLFLRNESCVDRRYFQVWHVCLPT